MALAAEGDLFDTIRSVRPMARTDKFEDQVALTGVGMSPIGRKLMVSPLSLTVVAIRRAVADAGLSIEEIDGLSTYPAIGCRGWLCRRWHQRRGVDPGHPAHLAQRGARDPGRHRFAHRGHVGGGRRTVPPRGVLSHGLAVDGHRAGPPGRDAGTIRAAAVSGADEHLAPFGAQAVQTVAMAASHHMARYARTRSSAVPSWCSPCSLVFLQGLRTTFPWVFWGFYGKYKIFI